MAGFDAELEGLHRRSSRHRPQILGSEMCGCFYCCSTFPSTTIKEWIDDRDGVGQTALCPRCGIDSVLPLERVDQVSAELLGRMHMYWFSKPE